MSLAKLAHATISSEESFSNEDRIEILIRDMVQRFAKLEERVASVTWPRPANVEWNLETAAALEKSRVKARMDLERAVDMAESAIKATKQDGVEESDERTVSLNRLREALRTYRGYSSIRMHDELYNRAQQLLKSDRGDIL